MIADAAFQRGHGLERKYFDFCCNLLQIAIYILHIAMDIQEAGVPLQATERS
jgi:hypothetical protein